MYCLHVQVLTMSEELEREKGELERLVDLKEKGSTLT